MIYYSMFCKFEIDKRNSYLKHAISSKLLFNLFKLIPGILPLFIITIISSSCTYYAVTKQSLAETTPFDIDVNVKMDYPHLSGQEYYELLKIDNKPVKWTSKYQVISLSSGVHEIEAKIDKDYYTHKSEVVSERFDVVGNKITLYENTTSPHNFKYHGVVAFDFKKKCSYYISNNGKYNDDFQFIIGKHKWSQTSSGSFILSTLGLIGVVGIIAVSIF